MNENEGWICQDRQPDQSQAEFSCQSFQLVFIASRYNYERTLKSNVSVNVTTSDDTNPLSLHQVEFSYPPLMPDEGHDSNVLPGEWKYLPFLALPDGAHNYQEGRNSFSSLFTLMSIWILINSEQSGCHVIGNLLTLLSSSCFSNQ